MAVRFAQFRVIRISGWKLALAAAPSAGKVHGALVARQERRLGVVPSAHLADR